MKPSPARLRDRAEMLAAGSGLSNSLRGLRGFELCFEFKQLIHQYILVLVIVLQLCVLTIHEIHQCTNQKPRPTSPSERSVKIDLHDAKATRGNCQLTSAATLRQPATALDKQAADHESSETQ